MTTDPKRLYAEGVEHFRAGRLAEAQAALEAVVAAAPNSPEPLFQLGRVRAAQGDGQSAEKALRKALKLQPKAPAIWQALHGVLRGGTAKRLEREAQAARVPLGTMAEVAPILKRIASDPALAEREALALAKSAPAAAAPAYALGAARLAQGKVAVQPLETALERDPTLREARLALARAYLAVGRPTAAQTVLAEDQAPDAALIRAKILRDTGQPEDAVSVLEPLPPGRRTSADLAQTFAAAHRGTEAQAAVQLAVKNGASMADLSHAVAAIAEEAGDIPTAEAVIDRALAQSETAGLLTHRAQLAQSAGAFAEADTWLTRALALDATHGSAYRAALNARKVPEGDPVATQLMQALQDPSVKKTDRADMHFAAAKAAFDQRRDGDAAEHLTTANRLLADLYPHDIQADVAEAQTLLEDWEGLKDQINTSPETPAIFVTGLPRSGTTLVETILAAHSQTATGGEMPFLNRVLTPVIEALRHGGDVDTALAAAGPAYLALAQRRAPRGIVIDKAISTFSRIGHTLKALPGARIVLVRRDPRDVALSLFRNRFPDGMHRYAYDLTAMGRYIRLHDALIDEWRSRCPDRIHVVEYEALTEAPEPQIRAMLDAVGLPFDAACLNPQDHAGRIQTLSFAQARQPIGRDAVASWRRFEPLLAPAIAALETDMIL